MGSHAERLKAAEREAKSRRSKKGGTLPWESRHVQLVNGFRQERAWKALRASSRVVYIEIKAQYNGYNNGRIMASERFLAARTGLAKNTVSRALEELQAKGFLAATKQGSLGVEGKGHGSNWRLTEIGQPGFNGGRPTREFKDWRPGKQKPGRRINPGRTQNGARPEAKSDPSGSRTDPGTLLNLPCACTEN